MTMRIKNKWMLKFNVRSAAEDLAIARAEAVLSRGEWVPLHSLPEWEHFVAALNELAPEDGE